METEAQDVLHHLPAPSEVRASSQIQVSQEQMGGPRPGGALDAAGTSSSVALSQDLSPGLSATNLLGDGASSCPLSGPWLPHMSTR